MDSRQHPILQRTIVKLKYASVVTQMHDLLLLSKIINNRADFKYDDRVCYSADVTTRSAETVSFNVPRAAHSISEDNYWHRTPRLANLLPEEIDIFNDTGLKKRLTELYWNYFVKHYQEKDPCSWTIGCDCSKCKSRNWNFLNYLST